MKNLNNFEVIVQAGGRGSRLRHYTWNKPKCLVSYEGKPVIFHLFDVFKNSNFHIIADYQIDKIKKYFKINQPSVNFNVYCTKHKGTCAGIKDVLRNIDQKKKIIIIWSDLIIIKLPVFKNKATIITTSSFTCRWSIINNKIVEKTSANTGIPGIFYFQNKNLLKKIPKSGEFVKWYSNNIKKFNNLNFNKLKEIGDFSSIEKSYNKIGYGRYFNKIMIKKNYVIKKSIDKNYNHLINKEINWYNQVSKIGYKDIPKIYSRRPFKIQRINGKHLFEFKDLNSKTFTKIIENILQSLNDLHSKKIHISNTKEIKDVYINKTLSRLKSVSKIIPNFSSTDTFTINGIKCKNYLFKNNKKIFDQINNFLYNDKFNSIHGDPTLSNILIKNNLKPIFFDPRGYFANNSNILGDKYYDFSKVYYSLIGNYDSFNRRKFKLYVDNYSVEIMMDNIYPNNADEIFKSEFKKDIKKIEVIHALIWLSLSGYVKDDIDSILASFYNGIYWMNKALN